MRDVQLGVSQSLTELRPDTVALARSLRRPQGCHQGLVREGGAADPLRNRATVQLEDQLIEVEILTLAIEMVEQQQKNLLDKQQAERDAEFAASIASAI